MTQLSPDTTITWKKAKVRVTDQTGRLLATHRRVRFVLENSQARVEGHQQMLLASAQASTTTKPTVRTLHIETTTGDIWTVEQMGCGCGS